MVRLKTFGGLSLVGEGIPPAAMQRRRLALLVLLARAGDRGISKDRVLAYLWPDHSSQGARHALDQLLYATRRDLGREAVQGIGLQLRLDAALVQADCSEFESLLDRDELQPAVDLYAGPFLDGVHLGGSVELERWLDGERALLAERMHGALEALAEQARVRGDADEAVFWWRRRAALEPLNGRVARRLVEVLAGTGDRDGALTQARVHAALVRAELECDPDPELIALAERIRATNPLGTVIPDHRRPNPADREVPSEIPPALPDGPPDSAWADAAPATRPSSSGQSIRGRWSSLGALVGGLAVLLAALFGLSGRERLATPAGEPDGPASRRAPDPGAEELYLRARVAWSSRSGDGLNRAVVLFRQATERDPRYAEAHAGLASAYVLLGYLGYLPGDAAFPKGKGAALQALALDPDLGEAHGALGKAYQWEGRWSEAEQAFLRAVHHAPESATVHQWYALFLRILHRPEESVQHAIRAAELEPLSIQVQNTLGMMLYNAGAADSAFAVFQRVVTHEPDTAWVRANPWVLANFAKVAAAVGRHGEAVQLAERAAEAVPGHPRLLHALASVYRFAGDTTSARTAFARADRHHPHYTVYRALTDAETGNIDGAFSRLSNVQEWSLAFLGVLSGDPSLAPLRADPRYADLRRRMGLPTMAHE